MSRCKNCNIEVLDETERCPLCHTVLEQTVEVENMYPNVRIMTRKLMFISKIYLFCAIVLEVILIDINMMTASKTWWSIITGLGLLYVYMVLRFAILGQSGYKSKITIFVLMAVLILIASDFVVGYRGWSVNFAIPISILLVDAGIVGLMLWNRRNWQSYMMWQIFMILCSIIPIVLYMMELLTMPHLAFLPMAVSVGLFLGTLIIGDRRARVELKRRFHIN